MANLSELLEDLKIKPPIGVLTSQARRHYSFSNEAKCCSYEWVINGGLSELFKAAICSLMKHCCVLLGDIANVTFAIVWIFREICVLAHIFNTKIITLTECLYRII